MGLTAEIYRCKRGSSAPGGVSETKDTVTIVNIAGPFDPTEDRPAVLLKQGAFQGIVIAVEAEADENGDYKQVSRGAGPMFGGAFIATSDARFANVVEAITGQRFYGAVPLHDRFE